MSVSATGIGSSINSKRYVSSDLLLCLKTYTNSLSVAYEYIYSRIFLCFSCLTKSQKVNFLRKFGTCFAKLLQYRMLLFTCSRKWYLFHQNVPSLPFACIYSCVWLVRCNGFTQNELRCFFHAARQKNSTRRFFNFCLLAVRSK